VAFLVSLGVVAGRRSVPINTASDVVVICTAHEPYKTLDFSRLGVPVVDCRHAATLKASDYYSA